jgi:NAD+ kinase
MRVGIVAQKDNERAAALAADVRDAVAAGDVTVSLDEATASALGEDGTPADEFDTCDLVVSVGGDGTFLYAAHGAGDVPILGVNLGEVGFLNAVAPDDAVAAVEREVERFRERGAVRATPIPRLQADGDAWALPPALNEVVVLGSRRGHGGGAEFVVRVDDAEYAEARADGVLVAMPTGSTAYNLSERGPLVAPGVDGFVVTLMNAHDPMPPLVVDADSTVSVDVAGAARASVVSDGRDAEHVEPPATVTVGAAEPARVAGPGLDFFGALGKLETGRNGKD